MNNGKKISVLGVPLDMGASTMGTRMGPEAIRISGLIHRLKDLDYDIEDLGDIEVKNGFKIIPSKENINHLDIVKDANEKIYKKVDKIFVEGKMPLVLGGDHSLILGRGKAILNHYERPGLLYFDAHGDINTVETSPTGNIHGMPIAALMGFGHKDLIDIGNKKRWKKENIIYIGLRDLDPGEKIMIRDFGIKAYSMEDIDGRGIVDILNEAINYIDEKTDSIHISFDVDCLDPLIAPGTGVKVPGGMNFREAKTALRMLSRLDNISSADFVEVNPLLDNQNQTADICTDLICTFFGEMQL